MHAMTAWKWGDAKCVIGCFVGSKTIRASQQDDEAAVSCL